MVIVRPSLGGTLTEGKEQTFTALLDLMQPAVARIERSVNIIGPTLNTFNWRADVFELKRMLSAIGVQVNTVLTSECTVAELVQAPRAALNLCVYPYDCGIPTAQKMHERFGIPWMANRVPIGFRQSAAWIEEIAQFFNIDARPYLAREMKSARDFIGSLLVFNTFFEASVALSTDNCDSYSVGISSFLKRELGMDICMAAVSSDAAAQKVAEVCPATLLNPTIDDKKSMLLEKSPSIVLGNFYDLKLTTDLGFKNFLFADIPLMGYIFSENSPFMGFMGAKNLTQSIGNEMYTKIFIETKGEMDGPISAGDVHWHTDAERALGRIAESIPHFARSIAIKKMHQVADEIAQQKKSPVTLEILQEVAMKYTPTRFKAKNATIFADMQQTAGSENITFTMPWDPDARELLEMVPEAFAAKAVSATEQYAREKNQSSVTAQIVEEYRQKLGF
jgi:hypothetical protein